MGTSMNRVVSFPEWSESCVGDEVPRGNELGAAGEGLQGGGALSKDVGHVRGHLVA